MTIAVCVKWVDLRPEVDAFIGVAHDDRRRFGFSEADRAALEVGLRLAAERGVAVTLIAVADNGADDGLRELAACGAASVVRIELPTQTDASAIAASIAASIIDLDGVSLVVCGDQSVDWGSGAVPGLVAHHLGWAQALGAVEVGSGLPLGVVRRLDGGRRERLSLAGPAVVSVEGSVARLRRAGLRELLRAKSLPIVVRAPVETGAPAPVIERTDPIRPRPRVLAPPSGDRALQRVVELTGALVERTPPRRVEASPEVAAAEIVAQLRTWGYVE